jgi:hypothetical protein
MMILNNTVPPSAATVNSNPAFSLPYVQIGLETGQSAWEMDVNSPVPDLFDRTHHLFKGGLTCASSRTLYEIEQIATAARQHDLPVYVVYEAGAFGQKLGRDISRAGGSPVQLVARNIEYVRFGTKQQDVPKTDRIDSQRQSHIPLDHPDLPYADVQTEQEESLRNLFKEKKRLEKSIHRLNAQMCAHLRSCHIGLRHCSVPVWETRFEELSGLSSSKRHCLENQLSELKDVTEKHQIIIKLLLALAKEVTDNWQPPAPEAQPTEPGRHSLQALGENSPLRERSLPQALLEIKGIGSKTMLTILALVGDPRRFKNKKAFRAYMALAPTPYRSCTIRKSLGMKRGNPDLRKLMIQLAWRWCSMHPDTHLAQKYLPKLTGSRRSKKIAVCALAGELAEMLYTHLVHGKEIAGLNKEEH